jgi:hypothetical protein
VTCSTTKDHPWLTIGSKIVCDDCVLRPGETAPHKLHFKNYGPLEAKIDLTAVCNGPCLRYEGGSTTWNDRVSVPKSRWRPGKMPASKGIELPAESKIGKQGTDEGIEIEVKRLRGNGTAEKPAQLALRIKLRPSDAGGSGN